MAQRITDLGRPRLPVPLRLVNTLASPFAAPLLDLDESKILALARRRAGFDDFGAPAFREPLGVLLRALDDEAELTPIGRYAARELVLGLLVTRLRLFELLRLHPEIRDEPIVAPIVVMGLPRTGTTHLHELLGCDATLRSLPYWECLEPIADPLPTRGSARANAADDPRFARCSQALRLLHYAMPLFPAMHEMAPEALHEEVQLLAVDFSTMLFEASNTVPGYRDWYTANDQTFAYRTLRLLLQALQWTDGRVRRWVLKSPQHMEQIGPLLAAFPDAKIIQTHRDPVRVTASFCTMGTYSLRMGRRRIDPVEVGAYWASRIEDMLRASVRDRRSIPVDQIHDLRFPDFVADPPSAARAIFEFAGQPVDADLEQRWRVYQAVNPRGRHGSIDYRLDDFGLVAAERREALRFYQERFSVADESR